MTPESLVAEEWSVPTVPTEGLKHIYFSQLWKLKVQDHGVGKTLTHGFQEASVWYCGHEEAKERLPEHRTVLPGDGGRPGMDLFLGCWPSHPLVLMASFCFPLQPATATSTLGAADSTWSSTSCQGARVGVSVSTVATILQAATATTARRASTETWASPSPTGRLAKVGCLGSGSRDFSGTLGSLSSPSPF